jgi:hypothetical protein
MKKGRNIMAMIKCKECGKEVSTKAGTCPNCGVKIIDPKGCLGCLGLILILSVGFIIFSYISISKKEAERLKVSEEAKQQKMIKDEKELSVAKAAGFETVKEYKENKCRKDLQCWGDKHGTGAEINCPELIERLAKYSFKWTDNSWTSSKFNRFRWKNKEQGVLTYLGDSIQIQNGFGAWQNYIYSCDYDPLKKIFTNPSARPGRFPKPK